MLGALHSRGPAHPAPQKRQFSGGDGGGQQEDKRARTDAWKSPGDVVSNGLFEEYYKEQGVCPPEVRPPLPPPASRRLPSLTSCPLLLAPHLCIARKPT